jgi:hypothetical protein
MGTPGRFVWYDLLTTDPVTSIEYYSKLFGWNTTEWDMGEFGRYTALLNGEQPFGGVVPLNPDDGTLSHWISYVTVDDVDAACERATAHGGQVGVPGTDIPGIGRFAVVIDPQGAVISPFMGAEGQEPPDPDGRPAVGSFAWSELLTHDTEAAKAFYGELFGWSSRVAMDMGEMGVYTIFRRGEDQDTAGMMKLPTGFGASPRWLNYVLVEDLPAVSAEIANLGGQLWVDNKDVPGVGAFSVGSDPTGASIAIWKAMSL